MAQRETGGVGDARRKLKIAWWKRRFWLEEPQASCIGVWLAMTVALLQLPFMNAGYGHDAFVDNNGLPLLFWAPPAMMGGFGLFHICEYFSWSVMRKVPVLGYFFALMCPKRPPQRDDVNAIFDTM